MISDKNPMQVWRNVFQRQSHGGGTGKISLLSKFESVMDAFWIFKNDFGALARLANEIALWNTLKRGDDGIHE